MQIDLPRTVQFTTRYLQGVIRNPLFSSGAEGSRTLDLCIANAALSQLSYRPEYGLFAVSGGSLVFYKQF